MKRVRLSLLALAATGAAAFGQPPVPPADPKVATPGSTDPKDPPEKKEIKTDDPLLKDALAAYNANDLKKCMDKLKEATDKNKNLQPPEIIYASWLVQSRKGPEARMVVEQFIARNVGHPDGYLLNASFAYGEGRITDAINSCLNALNYSKSPQWGSDQQKRFEKEARLGLVASLEARGDFGNMHEHVAALVNADEKNAALHQRLAAVKFNIGQPESAFGELEIAYKLDTAIDPPELRMGALWASKAPTNAGTTPKDTPEQVAAAAKKEIEENRKKAEEFLKKAVAKYTESSKPARGYASFMLEEGNLPEALKLINQASDIDKKETKNNKLEARETASLRALYHRYKGSSAAASPTDSKNDFAEAVKLFDELFKANPSDPFATGNLAIVLTETGDKERAQNLANTLVKGNEKSAEAYAVLGWVLFRNALTESDKEKAKAGIENADKALGASASGGQAMLDTAYYLAEFFNYKKEFKKAYDLLKDSTGKKGAFVYRSRAEKLMADVKPLADKEEADRKAKEEKDKAAAK